MNKTAGKGKLETRKSAGSKTTHLPIAVKPIIERPIVDASKFPNTQPKMAQIQKLTAGTSNVNITNSLVSGVNRTPTSDVSPSSVNVPQNDVVLRRKPPLRRPIAAITCGRKAKERTVPIIAEGTKAVMLAPTKRADTANGRIYYSTSPTISHIFPAQLSITPVGATPTTKIVQVTPLARKVPLQRKYTCSQCKKPCPSPDKCEACRSPIVASIAHQIIPVVNSTEKLEQPVSTPAKVCIPKELFYGGNRIPVLQNIVAGDNYRVTGSRKVFVTPDQQGNPKGRPKGSKNRVIEPECLTISSDEEDRGDGSTSHNAEASSAVTASGRPRRGAAVVTFYDGRSAVTLKGNHVNLSNSNCIKTIADSSVADEREGSELIEEEDEEMEEEEEEEEENMNTSHEGMESDEETPFIKDGNPGKVTKGHLRLPCRSIRIGSFKIHPIDDLPYVSVYVTPECFHFEVSRTTKPSELVSITLKGPDIAQVLGHFGRCLPIIFIFTTPACAARIRSRLGMVKGGLMYYDPEVSDEKQKRITFLIDAMNDEIRNYLRNTFPGEGILKEIDQKAANEILVKSTPNQMNIGKVQTPAYQPPTPPSPVTPSSALQNQPSTQMPVQPIQSVVQSLQSQGTVALSITTLQPVQAKPVIKNERPSSPVRKIMTYPPAPHVGGITITNEDLACLDEGEFLNDAIIDFYLKYLINEKLSEADRKRTYIFSSYFYPRLTQKPATRSAEDASSSMALKRHRQVKTWTKNLDLFEKDFIIIPINQNVHWFLAIICYPGLVSKLPNLSQPPPSNASSKSSESDSPRNDQENEGPSNHCNNSLINTISPIKITLQTREQACETEDNSGSENSPHESCSGYDESEQSFPEDPVSDLPDSTHPDGLPAPGQKTPCIVVFDSLAGPSRWRVANNLREYLEMEWKIKKGTHKVFDKTSIKAFVPRVPQQTNYSDCGVYVLQYVESFFENPFPYLASPLPDMTNWFTAEKVATKREELKSLIHELEKRGLSSTSVTTNDSKTPTTRKNADSISSSNSSQSSRVTPS